MNTATTMYLQNQNFIHSKAWEYQKKVPHVSIDEFISEANETFVNCTQKFNPDRGTSFITYLGASLDRNLNNFLVFFLIEWEELKEYMMVMSSKKMEDEVHFKLWKESLSQKAQEIIFIVFNTPITLISSPKFRITKRSLIHYLKSNNWRWSEINNCFREISHALEYL